MVIFLPSLTLDKLESFETTLYGLSYILIHKLRKNGFTDYADTRANTRYRFNK